jgi:hypothetical protein
VSTGLKLFTPLWRLSLANEQEKIIDLSRQLFPNGHPAFNHITVQEMDLHSRKNGDYARGGSPLGNFERVSNILSNYPNLKVSDPRVVALVYALKQLDAALNMLSNNYEGQVEGMYERLADVAVYSKIVMCMLVDKQEQQGNV